MTTINKRAVAAAFGRAASGYHQHDTLQRRSATALLSALPVRTFSQVLDAGCGPGGMSLFWRSTGSRVTAVDLSGPMLAEACRQNVAHHYLEADIEALPLEDGGYDLVWSNLAVQWCQSLSGSICELYRMLRPGGILAFSTLAAGSLPELRQAWQTVDDGAHANRFLSSSDIARALKGYRCQQQLHSLTVTFDDALSAMRSLKGIGATHLHEGRASQTLTRGRLRQLQQAWPKQQGLCPLTYSVFTGVVYRD